METHKNVLGVVREMHQFPQINLVAKKKMKRVDTREAWLHEASYLCVAAIKKTAADLDIELTEPKNGYDVSMAPITSRRCIGVCYGASDCRDEKARIVIDVSLECPVRVIHVLLHELVHAYTNGDGHRGRFPKIMKALGSEGKMTATREGELQAEWISERVLTLLPEWSSVHSVWSFKRRGQRGKGSRLVKIQCRECECIFRMSNRWIDEAFGVVSCPCCQIPGCVIG